MLRFVIVVFVRPILSSRICDTGLCSSGLRITPERMSDADCGRGRLVPRFHLASRSAASGGTPCGCNCASQTGKVCSASIQSARCRLIACYLYVSVRLDLHYRLMFQRIANHTGTYGGCGLRAREACLPFSPREPQCRIRRHASRKAPSIAG